MIKDRYHTVTVPTLPTVPTVYLLLCGGASLKPVSRHNIVNKIA